MKKETDQVEELETPASVPYGSYLLDCSKLKSETAFEKEKISIAQKQWAFLREDYTQALKKHSTLTLPPSETLNLFMSETVAFLKNLEGLFKKISEEKVSK